MFKSLSPPTRGIRQEFLSPPEPVLPTDIVSKTQAKYLEAYQRLTSRSLDDIPRPSLRLK
jgi:hypothetical protein